jgi:hypothetical protein
MLSYLWLSLRDHAVEIPHEEGMKSSEELAEWLKSSFPRNENSRKAKAQEQAEFSQFNRQQRRKTWTEFQEKSVQK